MDSRNRVGFSVSTLVCLQLLLVASLFHKFTVLQVTISVVLKLFNKGCLEFRLKASLGKCQLSVFNLFLPTEK